MPLLRVLEPEVMDSSEEASDYDAMNHAFVNGRFCVDLLALEPDLSRTLDVGTGTALIPIELARRSPKAVVLGVDLADEMLALAARNVEKSGCGAQVRLERADAKHLPHAKWAFTCVVSNTILHHIPEPQGAIAEMQRVLEPRGLLFLRDLMRPEDDAGVEALVAQHAQNDTPRQRALFDASLRASLTLEEIRDVARALGMPAGVVRTTSDRHWTLAWRAS